ncbi:Serine/threonine-protein_phosphatase [Hexamita inflata]|uniref:Serine/threonine-protein phosphatase n=1 Tax=Hexamita inflata TaxID=28002 RepID=A0AA86U5I1_9EUKA|nr:Serine/threonine-protein phosphatase [Hexamita inflata]
MFNEDDLRRIMYNLTRFKIPDRNTTFKLIMQAIQYHQNMPNYIELTIDSPDIQVFLIGDLHGQFEDLIQILTIIDTDNGLQKQLIFLGDVVDRGFRSVETILLILCMQLIWPQRVIFLRGNHETESTSRLYGFFDECKRKHDTETCYKAFLQLFQTLPVALVLNYTYFEEESEKRFLMSDYDENSIQPSQESQDLLKTQKIPKSPKVIKKQLPEYFTERFDFNVHQKQVQEVPLKTSPIQFYQQYKPLAVQFQCQEYQKVNIQQKNHTPKLRSPQQSLPGGDDSIFGEQSTLTSFTNTSTGSAKLRKIFAVHGGISCHMQKIEEIALAYRIFNDFDESEDQRLIQDLLWADPDPSIDHFKQSNRGCSMSFGYKAAASFCSQNNVDLIIRAHQLQQAGFMKSLGDRVLTVWSAANYEQRVGNTGAFLLFQAGDVFVRQFSKQFYEGDKRVVAQVDYFL